MNSTIHISLLPSCRCYKNSWLTLHDISATMHHQTLSKNKPLLPQAALVKSLLSVVRQVINSMLFHRISTCRYVIQCSVSLRNVPIFSLILLNKFFLPCTSCSCTPVGFGFIVYLVSVLLCSSGEFSGVLAIQVRTSSVAYSTHWLFSVLTPPSVSSA